MDPFSTEAHAAHLWNNGAKAEAMALLERELQTRPNHAGLLWAAARASLGHLHFQAADEYIARALELEGNSPQARLFSAQLLMETSNQYEKAFAILQPLPEQPELLDPATASLTLELMDHLGYEERALELATAWADAAPAPLARSLILPWCRMLARRGGKVAALEMLREWILNSPPNTPAHLTIRAKYDLARLEDSLGQPGHAWESLRSAHRLYQRIMPKRYHPRSVTNDLRAATESIRKGIKAAHPSCESGGREPRVILMAGFPRSGTTLMQRLLVEGVPGLQVNDERDCMGTMNARFVKNPPPACGSGVDPMRQLGKMYLERICDTSGGTNGNLLLDKNPGYVHLIPTYARALQDVRVIWPVRDPRDVLLSCLFVYIPLNPTTPAFLDARALAALIKASYECWHAMRDQLTVPWIECKYENLVHNPEGESARLIDFVTEGLACETSSDRGARPWSALSPTYAEARRPVHGRSIGRWITYESSLKDALRMLAPLAKSLGY